MGMSPLDRTSWGDSTKIGVTLSDRSYIGSLVSLAVEESSHVK